jgi:hypothetical protein
MSNLMIRPDAKIWGVFFVGLLLLALAGCIRTGSPRNEETSQQSQTLPTPTPMIIVVTPTPRPTPVMLPTEKARPTLAPTRLPPPSATTVPGTLLAPGDPWHVAEWSLTVSDFGYKTFHKKMRFTLHNRSGRTVIFPAFSADQFRIEADTGETYAPCSIRGSGWFNTWWRTFDQKEIAAGEEMTWHLQFHPYDPEHRACDSFSQSKPELPPEADTLTLTVENIGDIITNARWETEIPRP